MPLSSAECARLHRCLLCLSVRRTTMKRPRWTFFMKRRMIFCRPLVLIILMLSLGGLGIQMLTVHGDIEHLATCFGPRNATFTVVTIGENINPSIAENLIENKLSWAKRHQAQLCWYFARMDRSRSTSWNKILATLHAMRCATKKGSHILTLDADAVIRNARKSPDEILEELEKYLNEYNMKNKTGRPHIIWSTDYGPYSPINCGAFLSVNGEKSAFVLEKIYNDLHGIKFHKVPHWSEQIGVHNFLANHKDEFDSTGVIVKNDIFNQHATRSLNDSFIAHFSGMGRSSNKYEKIVEPCIRGRKITILWVIHHHRITPTSIDTITGSVAQRSILFFLQSCLDDLKQRE